MPYNFSFDLSTISKSFFRELARSAHKRGLHKRLGMVARHLAEKFKLSEITGLDMPEALQLVEDLIDVYIRNVLERERFTRARRKALFLPHCARKYMDKRCQASFDLDTLSYYCVHCSSDCLVNQATLLGKRKGYDVYVLPGGSCVPEILRKKRYDGVLGVACSQELKLGGGCLKTLGLVGQGIPLIKNGCANTYFNLKSLEKVL